MEKGRISAAQLSILAFMSVLATSLLAAPGIVAGAAHQDMWLSPLWASSVGFLVMWMLVKLNQLHPNETLIQYAVTLLGRPIGKLVGGFYLFFTIYTTSSVLRQFTDFVKLTFLLKTPSFVISSSMALICALCVRGGIEMVGRLPMLLLPFIAAFILMIYMPSIFELKMSKFQPFLGDGVPPSLIGAFKLMSWLPGFTFTSYYLPYVANKRHMLRWACLSVALFTSVMCITFVIIYAVLGSATANYAYPFMVIARFVSFTEFFEHLESIVMMIWTLEIVIRISFGIYGTSLGLAQWLNLPDYKPVVIPLGMLLVLFSYWGISNSYFVSSPQMILFYLLFGLVIPAVLLGVGLIRHRILRPAASGLEGGKPAT
ncbi:spore germination protein [Paenibacillus curdlanolyticus YK9]|uniref:Spore germination protein n=1 Tax=Paenibacillus curdlanolyticus YK9 TaxID=717606 RepID=E0IEJ2_9BACL|nr:endospore germination permease [Paenibacillus curdlanolyticus]EFM09080.1 spore germination protein [Paenibacillus curdlanolyticus YK9]